MVVLGSDYVERGDYDILQAEDPLLIQRPDFDKKITPRMILEMIITMKESADFRRNSRICLRCSYLNDAVILNRGWVEW